MKRFLLLMIFFSIPILLFAQKKVLDHHTSFSWPTIRSQSITNDGKYVSFTIAIPNKGDTFVVQASDGSWKKELVGVNEASFTADSRRLVFQTRRDSLGIIELGAASIKYIPFRVELNVPQEGDGQWIFSRVKDSLGRSTLQALNLFTKEETLYPNVTKYFFNAKSKSLVLEFFTTKDSISKFDVKWLNLANGNSSLICKNCQTSQLTFNEGGKKVAFFTKEQAQGHNRTVIRLYNQSMDSARIVVVPSMTNMEGMSICENNIFFNKSGDKLLFRIENTDNITKTVVKKSNLSAQVSIRGVNDEDLQYQQASGPFWAIFKENDAQNQVTRLQQEREKGKASVWDSNVNWLATESNSIGNYNDYKWRISVRPDLYLISTKDGTRRLLKKRVIYENLSFSLGGKYVIWFDQEQKQWFTHNIRLNKTVGITKKIDVPIYDENDHPDFPRAENIVGWLENDKAVLIYDRYDIWQVDPDGIKAPVNITHGYGSKNKIKFQRLDFKTGPSPIKKGDTLLLSAFNTTTKYDGFFRLLLGTNNLREMIMSPNIYNYKQSDLGGSESIKTVTRARDSGIYLLTRMSAIDYPNLYVTSDFRNLRALTTFSPQKEYNWYTSELIHWHLPNGKPAEGILYKPENFNPHKKYPVIFYYYEKNAFGLNYFLHPELSNGVMNIPWFASNGYLICVPDIYYRIGHPGESAFNSVESAALYLSQLSWVDNKHMGIQGHSYGGFETNYIVSHSKLFAAAATASAVSNLVSAYGETEFGTWFNERRQGRIGATLWQRPDLYLENSAVFKADKVLAPVLIMHTDNDWGVHYSQGLQWYNELNRLEKKVWMLTYKSESHTLSNEQNRLDYSIRLGQFFDYYLKGAPAPKWMTRGVISGVTDDGLELDNSGVKP